MRLAYITNIRIPANDAQNIQVQAMACVFCEKLRNDFLLVSPRTKDNKHMKTNYKWQKVFIFSFLPRAWRYLMFIKLSFFYVLKFKPDVIYSRDIGVVFVYHLLGYKTVYEIHKPFETKVGDRLFGWLSRRIRVVAISQALKDFVLEKYKIGSSDVLAAHDGVFLEEYGELDHQVCKNRLCEELKIEKDKKIVFYSSNLYKGKGLEMVIELARQHPDKYFVIMGGRNSGELVEYPKNMAYIGRKALAEVPIYTKSPDLLLMYFTKELKTWKYHSALKMFEYMASGVPILSSNIGSITEVFNEGNSYLFDPENINEAVDKIGLIFDNYEEAKEKARQALEDVKEYAWKKRADKILSFIRLCAE